SPRRAARGAREMTNRSRTSGSSWATALLFATGGVALVACTAILGARDKSYAPDTGDAAAIDAPSEEPDASAPSDDAPVTPVHSPACDSGLTSCPAAGCVDLSFDKEHCGSCTRSCRGGDCFQGNCQPILIATGQDSPEDVQVDATSIYWTTWATPGGVYKLAK